MKIRLFVFSRMRLDSFGEHTESEMAACEKKRKIIIIEAEYLSSTKLVLVSEG